MKSLLPILLAVTLTGCAAIDPGKPSNQQIQGAQLGLSQASIQWPAQTWWTRYQDPQLNALVDQALAKNPSLAAAQARLHMANAAVRGARAVQLPQLNADYTQTRQRFPEHYIYPPPYAGSMRTQADLQLNLGFDLDLWGKNRSKYAAALSRANASQADTQVARNALVSAVVQSYFNLQGALEEQIVLSKIAKQLANVASITRQRKNAGLDTRVEVNQADSAVSSAKVQLSQAKTNATLLRHQLAALIGEGPSRGLTIQRIKLSHPPAGIPQVIPINLLGRRPDIIAAKLRVEATSSDISAAKAAFYPDINLSAFAGFMSLGLDNLFKGGSKVYGVGPAISLPIFDGGTLNAQLSGKRAERDLAIANYNQTLLQAVREVADAITSIDDLRQQIVDQRASYEAIASAYKIAVQRYKSGLGNFVQVLQAQNAVQKQAILRTKLRARAYNLDAQLATALGGGYKAVQANGTASTGSKPEATREKHAAAGQTARDENANR
jgi:NodT family efflux transporter outer membrane factor (OMF) lipoprotein